MWSLEINGKKIKIVQISGDYFSRGLKYGTICKDDIIINIDLCRDLCMAYRKIETSKIYEEVKRFIPTLRKYDKNIFEELTGIAKGAGVNIEDIVLLNLRSEIMNKLWGVNCIHEGCSTFAISSSDENKTFVAQTWDWMNISSNRMIILVEKDEESNKAFLSVTEAGIIANVGINNRGMSTLLNYISVLETSYKGAPYHFLLHRALMADNSFEAMKEMVRSPIAFASHIMNCDINQNVMSYEITSTGTDVRKMDDRYLCHTNHVLSNKLKCRVVGNDLSTDSKHRLDILDDCLSKLSLKDSIDVKDIYSILSYHSDEFSICKHINPNEKYGISTIFSVIYEYANGRFPKMFISFGEPCNNYVEKIDAEQLFDF